MNEKKPNETVIEAEVISASKDEAIMPVLTQQNVDVEKAMIRLEKNIDLYKRIRITTLKVTKPSDWADMGGTLYLQDKGAENIANVYGIDISGMTIEKVWRGDGDARYYAYRVSAKGYAKSLGRYVEDIGTCSQHDKFFGWDSVNKKFKEVDRVDEDMIIKKAVTNCQGRIIRRLTAMLGITLADLQEAGLDVSKIGKVEYKSGGQKTQAAAPVSKEAGDKKSEIWKMCITLAAGDNVKAQAYLREAAEWPGYKGKPVTGVEFLTSEKWIHSTYEKLKKQFDENYQGDQGDPGPQDPGQ